MPLNYQLTLGILLIIDLVSQSFMGVAELKTLHYINSNHTKIKKR